MLDLGRTFLQSVERSPHALALGPVRRLPRFDAGFVRQGYRAARRALSVNAEAARMPRGFGVVLRIPSTR